ncbi:hypothetical protein DPMN_075754 [Dreissena polymorpha]|uniref:Uncharacterized protein n=1 Tax=Dreissena polymorpha TaxID=45954 RepID=A0A9D3YL01_DREPO|nr:hypothetical protein DPMN_075754 [Dreissena polymorpha]
MKRSTNTLTTASAKPGSVMFFAMVTRLALLDLPTWNRRISSPSRRILLLLNKMSAGTPSLPFRMSYPSSASSSISAMLSQQQWAKFEIHGRFACVLNWCTICTNKSG